MKYISFLSIMIGVIVFATILMLQYQTHQQLEAMGTLRNLIDTFVYGRTNKNLLFLLSLTGATLGLISICKSINRNTRKYGWVGLSICMVDLWILLATGS